MPGGRHNDEHSALVNLTAKSFVGRTDLRVFKRGAGFAFGIGKFGTPGEADLMFILAPNGRVLYLEAKTGKARQQDNQKDFEIAVKKLGAQYHVFSSLKEAFDIVDNAKR